MEVVPQCFSLLLVGALLVIASSAAGSGSVRRNNVFGIRTRWSMRSDEAWSATHRAFRPYAWICLGLAVAFVVALIAVHVLVGLIPAVSILTVCGFGCIFVVIFIGLRAAKTAALSA
ncbi:MAG TPA: SdpI family protein, partial [Microbacterium sp.]|nr:SdpI family protein [Microbacterium sp.]